MVEQIERWSAGTRLFPASKARRTWIEVVKAQRQKLITNKLADMPTPEKLAQNNSRTEDKVEILSHNHFMPKNHLTKEENAN
jgi:hypothetical protein